mmetsp:Transcript_30854/g.60226  ORF Transcript_30854/g.60226 Transcript_30854/m.60226 type:complete len:959 (-) Transcript_30854:157-3033(-)|eukprot:CAMPEP_0175121898 /NCGR_PEP_ID=MMETSP0087-20121206/1422_1 /TAXON_ID=136419 /ORGANISM="Unknown Unknown, Strain D1" /LENGTH=958 /DNA_ID=CAMNT_0016403487 /DNA_START=52 /DNA_END=2928 /DNA_ORIENTATION=+
MSGFFDLSLTRGRELETAEMAESGLDRRGRKKREPRAPREKKGPGMKIQNATPSSSSGGKSLGKARKPVDMTVSVDHTTYFLYRKPKDPMSRPAGSATKTVLCVGEKPSIAQSIAQHLSRGQYTTSKGAGTPVHEFTGKFQGQQCKFKVTSVTGHVYGTDFVSGYESWDKTDPAVLFVADIEKKTQPKSNITSHLQRVAKGCDYLVLWLDCDKEGENICFEVIQNTENYLNRPATPRTQYIFRAFFSAISQADIERAMRTLGQPNKNESLSVDARQELDLRMGVAFTRFQSLYFQGKYGNLNSKLISFGPCQTPTLGFCVERHDEIATFSPEKYWSVSLRVAKQGDTHSKPLALEWERGRVFKQEVGVMFHQAVAECSSGLVTSVTSKKKSKARPEGLNTVEMLKVASKQLGIGPADAMHAAESLYIQGYISYPRTESTAYPQHFGILSSLKQLRHTSGVASVVAALLQTGITQPKKGTDAGDHPPITPCRDADEGSLTGNQWRLFQYICQHFVASVSADCTYQRTYVQVTVGSRVKEVFTATADRVIDPGFTAAMDWMAVANDVNLAFTQGESVCVTDVKLTEGKTSPPDYLTESELIAKMEKHGIGTDASIAVHINAICDRNFVQIGANRTLTPTPLGIVLVHGYYRIDPDLVKPTMRGIVERELSLIAKGQAQHGEVVVHALSLLSAKFAYFVQNISKMDSLFEAHFCTIENTKGRALGRCGKCRSFMKYISHKPVRLHCNTCDETYPLPQNGTIKLFMENKCPLDDFELVMFSTGGENGISYPLCPYCYSNPPFEKAGKAMSCNKCLMVTCKWSASNLMVRACPDHAECKGFLIFEPSSGPNWKLVCNQCNHIIKFANKAHKVRLLPSKKCPDCSSVLLSVDFHKDHNPLKTTGEEGTVRKGCLFCDEVLSSTAHDAYGNTRKLRSYGKGKRGRGRGRGAPKKGTIEDLLNHHG